MSYLASMPAASRGAEIHYLGSDVVHSGYTANKNAGWYDPTYAKPRVFDPDGDNRYGSDGYKLYYTINHGDQVLEEVVSCPSWIQSAELLPNVWTWGATIYPMMNKPGTSPLGSHYAGALNMNYGGGKNIFTFTLAEDKEFVLGVALPDQRWASAANTLRLSGAGADSGQQAIEVISPYLDKGITDNVASQWMNYAFFHVSGEAGDMFTLWAAHATATQATLAGLMFEAGPAGTPPAWSITYLNQEVQPLEHSLNGRVPILAWALPGVSCKDDALTLRNNGTLRTNVDLLWSKGIAATADRYHGTTNGTQAMAVTLQEAGIPIHLFTGPPAHRDNWTMDVNGKKRHFEWDFWPAGEDRWFVYDKGDGDRSYPVYALASPVVGYNGLVGELTVLKNGISGLNLPGIPSVAGMWMDYEGEPGPYDPSRSDRPQYHGVLTSGAAVRDFYTTAGWNTYAGPNYPAGTPLTTAYGSNLFFNIDVGYDPSLAWWQYTADLRYWLLDQSARKALTDVYSANVPMGNYGYLYSNNSQSKPAYDSNGKLTPVDTAVLAGTASMPVVYANNARLSSRLGGSKPPINQANADDVYWHLMLQTFSSSAQNAGSAGKLVTWVSRYVRDNTTGTYDYPMTLSLYKELLRHLWLRGADGMYAFNPYSADKPSSNIYMTAEHAVGELEYIREVQDEMLCFRSFLDNGTPMNFGYNAMFNHGPVWSGLAYNGQAVVRTVSPNSATTQTISSISVPYGAQFANIPAPPGGATWLLKINGTRQRVDARPPLFYLKLSDNYEDSSGNGLNADTIGAPQFKPDVPVASGVSHVLEATYGLYANKDNGRSLYVWTTGIKVDNVLNVMNVPAFTAEGWFKLLLLTQDGASIMGKAESQTNYDWILRRLEDGKLELNVTLEGSDYWLRTTNTLALGSGWHHIALTYDATGATPEVSLYVDGVKWAWGQSQNDVLSGALPGPMVQGTNDAFHVGSLSGTIRMNVDEVRFTPDALEPTQFLKVGNLQ